MVYAVDVEMVGAVDVVEMLKEDVVDEDLGGCSGVSTIQPVNNNRDSVSTRMMW